MARGKKTAKELTPEEKLAQALVPIEEQPYQIPENWCWTYMTTGFAECLDNFRKPVNATERTNRVGDVPYYGATGQVGWIDGFLTDEQLVLLGEDGAPFLDVLKDKAYMVDGKAWVNNHAHILRSYFGSIGNCYLVNYLNCFDFTNYVNGTTRLKLTQANMNMIPLPVPPLAEQERIVDRIESIFAKLDEAKEKAQEVVDGFELRKSAILHKAFTGELTKKWRKNNFSGSAAEYLTAIQKDNEETTKLNFKFWTNNILPEGWVESKIGNLLYYAGRIGWKGLKADEYKDEGPLLLSVYNLNEGDKVSYNKVYHISEQRYDESPEIMAQENDILLVKDGAGIGKLAYVKDLPQKSTINSSLLLIRSGESAYFKYIYYLLSGPSLQRIVKERITGSATPHLFQRDIKEFTIPIPPLQEQKFIASVLDNMIKKEQQAKETAEVVIEQIDVMKKAVLARAFRGELGTNDPEEESAVELLKSVINL